jgi:hypothetical protein
MFCATNYLLCATKFNKKVPLGSLLQKNSTVPAKSTIHTANCGNPIRQLSSSHAVATDPSDNNLYAKFHGT